MKGLVLAEKPSLMRAIQSAYQADKFSFDLDFAAFHGHLMGLAQPSDYHTEWEKWSIDELPLIPDKFRYLPVDRDSVQKILAKIKAGHYDFLVNACDAGREGELIFWSFYEANGLTLDVKRLWSSTTVESDLKQALHHLRPASDFDNLRASAKFRAEFDWLTGMNFSRAVSLKTKKKANIGRVVTPTLKMVVDREREIINFVPEAFYEVGMILEKDGEKFPGVVLVPPDLKQTRFTKKADAQAVLSSLKDTGTVLSVEKNRKSTKAPTLYSTLELQKDANRYYKFRATKTDALAQDLYEAGYISYPRTECRFIPTSLVPDIPKLLKPLERFPELTTPLTLVTPASIKAATTGKTYVDDSKLTDHHAIIPTTAVFDPSTLSADQYKLYLLIAKRFLAIFLPPYVIDVTSALIDCNGNTVKAAGRVVVDKGFSTLYQDKSKDTPLPPLNKGDIVKVSKGSLHEGSTKPPDRYTDKTLLDAMANAGRFVSAAEQRAVLKETAGIGTGATRSGILDKLEKTGMVKVDKGVFTPSAFGMSLIDAIGERDVCSPAMTAKWEELLRDLEEHGNPAKFEGKMLSYIKAETADIIAHVTADLSPFQFEEIGTCPLCGRAVVASKNFFRCVNYKAEKDPCTFIVSRKETMGTIVSEQDMKDMLAGKPTAVKTLTAKDGNKYKAALVINKDGRVAPAIGENAPKESAVRSKTNLIAGICKCPLCKDGRVYKAKKYYLCTNKDAGCPLILGQEICNAEITEEDVMSLIKGDTTVAKTFTWKTGKTGKAKLKGTVVKEGKDKSFKLEFIFT